MAFRITLHYRRAASAWGTARNATKTFTNAHKFFEYPTVYGRTKDRITGIGIFPAAGSRVGRAKFYTDRRDTYAEMNFDDFETFKFWVGKCPYLRGKRIRVNNALCGTIQRWSRHLRYNANKLIFTRDAQQFQTTGSLERSSVAIPRIGTWHTLDDMYRDIENTYPAMAAVANMQWTNRGVQVLSSVDDTIEVSEPVVSHAEADWEALDAQIEAINQRRNELQVALPQRTV